MDAGAKHIENHRSAILHVFDYVTPEYVSFPTELLDDESQSQEEFTFNLNKLESHIGAI